MPLVVLTNVLLVWLPVVRRLIAPAATERRLKAFNGYCADGHSLLTAGLVIAGAILAASSSYGLVMGW